MDYRQTEISILGDEVDEGIEGTKLSFSFFDRPLCLLFLGFPISSANPNSFSSRLSISDLLLDLRAFLGDAQPSTPIWAVLFLHRRRDPVGSTGSSPISSRSARRVLDLRSGEGERSKSSCRGRELEALRDRVDGEEVFLGDGDGTRSRESWGDSSLPTLRLPILARREAHFIPDRGSERWEGGVDSINELNPMWSICERFLGSLDEEWDFFVGIA